MNNLNLTNFARMGGCSCKLGAEDLARLCSIPEMREAMLPGLAPDDAAIVPIGDGKALVTSIDFQNAVVDDAAMAGEIAAKNALSDIFACGVRPLYADVVLVVPYGDEAVEVGKDLMRGVARACGQDGCAIVGGHTIRGETPIVGLSVFSIASIEHVKRKSGATPGDLLMLTKPLGNGVAVAARQQGLLADQDYSEALSMMLRSNRVGARLGPLRGVSAMTDITGFGLLGHMSEVATSSGVTLRLNAREIPLLPGVFDAVREGAIPLLCEDNLETYGGRVGFLESQGRHERLLLCDPQTNGGLLFAVHPEASADVQAILTEEGVDVWTIGEVTQRHASGRLVEIVS